MKSDIELESEIEMSHDKSWQICVQEKLENSKDHKESALEETISFLSALKELACMSFPSILGIMIRKVIDITNYIVVGRMADPDIVSGVGMGIVTSSILCISVGIGLAGGLDTLCSQAFGNKQNYLAGWYYNRAQVILTILFVPQAIALYFCSDLLIWIGQPANTAQYTEQYIRILIPGVYSFCQTELLRRYLGTQGIFTLLLKFQIMTTLLHFLWVYILVFVFTLGITGIAVATWITHISTFAISALWITINKSIVKEDSWHCINKDSFNGLREYLRYGIPSLIMILLEFWCFESIILMSGYLGSIQQGATLIILNFVSFLFAIAIGISFSTASLVGNSLGANQPENAKRYASMSVVLSLLLSTVISSMTFLLRNEIAAMFTEHEEIALYVVGLTPVMASLITGDFLQVITGGVIRAMGYQKKATVYCILMYWLFIVPFAYLFAFKMELGVNGLWLSSPIGLTLLSIAFIYVIFSTDWNVLSQQIVERIQKEKEDMEKKQSILRD